MYNDFVINEHRWSGQNKTVSNVQNNCRQLEHTFEVFCATDRKSVPSHCTPSHAIRCFSSSTYQSSLGRLGLVLSDNTVTKGI